MMIKRGGLNQDSPLFQVNTKLYKDCNGAKLNDHYGNNMYMKNRFLKSFYSHIVIFHDSQNYFNPRPHNINTISSLHLLFMNSILSISKPGPIIRNFIYFNMPSAV